MPGCPHRLFSIFASFLILGVVAGCNLSTSDVSTVSPGDSCEDEGATSGSLVCEDGIWVEDGRDVGVDTQDDAGDGCAEDQTECDGQCVNTDRDLEHCGGCNQPCSDDEVCDGGGCESSCTDGRVECGGECVDIDLDDDHCGGCFQGCNEDESCGGGWCKPDCLSGQEWCEGQCVDTDTSPDHCGGCNQPCENLCHDGECLECVVDDDCPEELSCGDNNICLGCLDDGDCDGAAKCHDQYPVCVDECCDFAVEDVAGDVSVSFDQIGIDVTADGEPVIAFVDGDSDTIRIAERIDGNWYTQDAATVSTSSSTYLRFALDDDGEPHIVYRRFEEWKYLWREGSTWHEEEVWDEELSTGYTDIAIDSDGNAHIIGDHGHPESHRINYATYSPQAGWQRDTFEEISDDKNFNWMVLQLTSDDEPVMSLAAHESGQRDLYVVRRSGSGIWESAKVVDGVNQLTGMDVGPYDEVVLATIPMELPHDGLELTHNTSGTWALDLVNTREEAFHPVVAVDDLGDPHFAFSDTTGDQSHRHLAYTRWDGSQWETHDVSQTKVEWAQRLRIAVDNDSVPHIVVYDSPRNAIVYVTVD